MAASRTPSAGDARTGWSRRLFAYLMARHDAHYERLVVARKRALLGSLAGTVIEIGPGTGVNLQHYAPGVQWIGVEPNVHMHPYVEREAARLGRTVDLRTGRAERLDAADASADAVVSTLVLCSVDDLAGTVREIRRVLKPGGRFVFIEHVAAPKGTGLRRRQRLLRPFWRVMGDGCRPDRETGAVLEAAGFEQVTFERFRLDLPIVGPHIAGTAVKGATQPHPG